MAVCRGQSLSSRWPGSPGSWWGRQARSAGQTPLPGVSPVSARGCRPRQRPPDLTPPTSVLSGPVTFRVCQAVSSPPAYGPLGPAAWAPLPSNTQLLATRTCSFLRGLVRNAEPQALPQTYRIRFCISLPPSGNWYTQESLRSTSPAHSYSSFKTPFWHHGLQEVFLTPPAPRPSEIVAQLGALKTLLTP